MCTLFMKLSDSCLIKSALVLITFDVTIHYCFGKKALERDSRRLLCGAGERFSPCRPDFFKSCYHFGVDISSSASKIMFGFLKFQMKMFQNNYFRIIQAVIVIT